MTFRLSVHEVEAILLANGYDMDDAREYAMVGYVHISERYLNPLVAEDILEDVCDYFSVVAEV